MINAFAVNNYRSLNKMVSPLGELNVVTGANGSGKSNLYKALRLLAETTQGNLISSIANEGGLDYTFWAGPDAISKSKWPKKNMRCCSQPYPRKITFLSRR